MCGGHVGLGTAVVSGCVEAGPAGCPQWPHPQVRWPLLLRVGPLCPCALFSGFLCAVGPGWWAWRLRGPSCCSEELTRQLGFAGREAAPHPSVEGRRRVRALASFNHLKRGLSSKDIYEITRSKLKWKYRKRYFTLFKCLILERIALNLDVKIPKCLSMWVLKEES